VTLAAVFAANGHLKWVATERIAGLFMSVHIPFPDVTVRLVATLEVVGAALLLAGVWTRLVGAWFVIEMAVAIVKVVWPQGFIGGYEFELTLLTVALALAIAGGGAYSLGRDRLSR
jgi:uncharacterized membrane protein YphA (DoxX/SURF4 family)